MTQWAKRWNQFADRHDADVSEHLTEQDRNKIDRIRDAKEKNVDRAYAQILSNHLKQMVDRFRHERWDERRDAAGMAAQKEISVLEDLLQRARTLERHTAAYEKK